MLPETYQGSKNEKKEQIVTQPVKEASAWEVYRPLLADRNQQGVMGMNFAVFCCCCCCRCLHVVPNNYETH